jgi:hypothetical protein
MEPQLGLVLSQIATLVNDEHPRVRYALVHCIGQLCTDFEVRHVPHSGMQALSP